MNWSISVLQPGSARSVRIASNLISVLFFLYFINQGLGKVQMAYIKLNSIENKVSPPLESFWKMNKHAVLESIDLILEWPFERIILAHGKLIERDAKKQLKDAYSVLELRVRRKGDALNWGIRHI